MQLKRNNAKGIDVRNIFIFFDILGFSARPQAAASGPHVRETPKERVKAE